MQWLRTTTRWHCGCICSHTEGLLSWSAVKTLKKSLKPLNAPRRKPRKTKLWELELRRLKEVRLPRSCCCDLVSCDPYILSKRESDGWAGTAAPQWPPQMNEDANGGRWGEVKAFSATKCTPEAVARDAQPPSIKDRTPPFTHPDYNLCGRIVTWLSRTAIGPLRMSSSPGGVARKLGL